MAIVGMSCRFAGASDTNSFWRLLRDGMDTGRALTDEELERAGIPRSVREDPSWVRAGSVLEDAEHFDAAFFGYSPREAKLIDPQQRIFLDLAYTALEDSGWTAESLGGRVGVFGGSAISTYLLRRILPHEKDESADFRPVLYGNDKDFLTTRVSYKLDLNGPSIAVQTACSTSLVAVVLAWQSLVLGQCDLALAGGVSVAFPQGSGYRFQEGGILSPDGRCRAFDARAAGTWFGNGGAMVALRRLEDALADGDHIHAIIRGAAINNDGSQKVGFTAPSVERQADVIAQALAIAGIDARSIGYVEAHGTGTRLGDPIEVTALTRAFRRQTPDVGFCGIGSVKTNLGHLNTAAGIAGLMKATLSLEHREIPPSLHFETPNPEIPFASSPFFVNHALRPWSGPGPLRAGVSAFGIGGTNAHVILEEAPRAGPRSPRRRRWVVYPISAKSASAVRVLAASHGAHLAALPEDRLEDAAFTAAQGRTAHPWRSAIVADTASEAARRLAELGAAPSAIEAVKARSATFAFSGQGTQYAGMGRGLYAQEPAYREAIDRCAAALSVYLGMDIRELLHPTAERANEADERMSRTEFAQPALLCVGVGLSAWWSSLGIRPLALIGHSIGELIAAHVAGVFNLDDIARIVVARGRLMQQMPSGAMLAVALPESSAAELAKAHGLTVAAINGPRAAVLSGSFQAIAAAEQDLETRGIRGRRLATSHAFHSDMMDPVLPAFEQALSDVRLRPPKIPLISNVSGRWLTEAEATDPRYWTRHLRATVRFGDGMAELLSAPERIVIEIGPGNVLTRLAGQSRIEGPAPVLVSSLPGREPVDEDDVRTATLALAKLWTHGLVPDWSVFFAGESRRRIALPSYPFERKLCAFGSTEETKGIVEATLPTSAAATETERKVAAVWKKHLGVTEIGVDADFFSLGGDSLLAMQVRNELQETFRVDLAIRDLLDSPTLAAVAATIDRKASR